MHVMHTHAHVRQEELILSDVAAADRNGGLIDRDTPEHFPSRKFEFEGGLTSPPN